MLWHVVMDMVDQAENHKAFLKVSLPAAAGVFLVQVDMFYYAPLAEWAAISGIGGSIKMAWGNEPATLWHE